MKPLTIPRGDYMMDRAIRSTKISLIDSYPLEMSDVDALGKIELDLKSCH